MSHPLSNKMIMTNHSIASSSPSPFVADVLNIAHVRLFKLDNPRALEISDGLIAPSIS